MVQVRVRRLHRRRPPLGCGPPLRCSQPTGRDPHKGRRGAAAPARPARTGPRPGGAVRRRAPRRAGKTRRRPNSVACALTSSCAGSASSSAKRACARGWLRCTETGFTPSRSASTRCDCGCGAHTRADRIARSKSSSWPSRRRQQPQPTFPAAMASWLIRTASRAASISASTAEAPNFGLSSNACGVWSATSAHRGNSSA